jgi:hypothetical protein
MIATYDLDTYFGLFAFTCDLADATPPGDGDVFDAICAFQDMIAEHQDAHATEQA